MWKTELSDVDVSCFCLIIFHKQISLEMMLVMTNKQCLSIYLKIVINY